MTRKVEVSLKAKLPPDFYNRSGVAKYHISRYITQLEDHFRSLLQKAQVDLIEAKDERQKKSAEEQIHWFTMDLAIVTGFCKSMRIKIKK